MDAIRNRGRLVVGVAQDVYLFSYRDPDTGELKGFDIDFARAVAGAISGDPLKIQYVVVPASDRVSALVRGDVDIVVASMGITCERKTKIQFSTSYLNGRLRVLVDKRSTKSALNELGGERVCTLQGSSPHALIGEMSPRPIRITVAQWTDCLVLLQQGQVTAILGPDSVVAGMTMQDPTTKIVGQSLAMEPYGIGLPLDRPDLVRFVNGVLDDMRSDGRWAQTYGRWLEQYLGPAKPPLAVYSD